MQIREQDITWDIDPDEIQWDDEKPFDLEESITGELPKEVKKPSMLPEGAGQPISTITGRPVPTPEEEFAGAKAVMSLLPHAFASFTRGMIPPALETAIMQPVTKLATGYDYVSPATEAQRVSGEYLPETAREVTGVPAQMAGMVVPLSVAFKTADAALKMIGLSAKVMKDTAIANQLTYHILRGGAAGGIYGGIAEGTPEGMAKDAALFAVLEGVFGTAAPIVSKISKSNWYRKLSIKERGLVTSKIAKQYRAGMTEADVLRFLGKESKTYKEALKLRKITPEQELKPVAEAAPELKSTPEQALRAKLRKAEKAAIAKPEQIAKQTGTTYKGKASGLHYWDVDVGGDAPTTIATKTLNADILQKEALKTQEKFKKAGKTPEPIAKAGLIQEAKKYDSVEKFISTFKKAYHGSDKALREFDISRPAKYTGFGLPNETSLSRGYLYFSDKKTFAKEFGTVVNEAFISKDAKIFNPDKASEKELIDIFGEDGATQRGETGGIYNQVIDIVENPETAPIIRDKLKNRGYDGVYVDEGEQGVSVIRSTALLNPDKVKTKSQLTDIWDKAHAKPTPPKPAEPKPLEALEAEAKKYKTAEEFVNKQNEYLYHSTSDRFLEDIKATGLTKDVAETYPHGIKKISDDLKRIYFSPKIERASEFGGGTILRIKRGNLDVAKLNDIRPDESWYFGDTIKPENIEIKEGGNWYPLKDRVKSVPKSQLTDIWNKVHAKPEPSKPVKPKPSETVREEVKGKVIPEAKKEKAEVGTIEPKRPKKVTTADQIAAERKMIETEMAEIGLKEYEKISKLASLRALEKIEKSELKEDRAMEKSAKKFAKEMVESSPIYKMIDDLKKQGGINYRSMGTLGISKDEIAELVKRHPGLVVKDGKIYADKMVDELGYDNISEFIEEVQYVTPKKEALERFFDESILETDQAVHEIRTATFYERFLDEEIKILNEMLGKKPKARKDIKKVIREKVGILKVGEIIEVKEREALRNQIRLEAKAARKAFSEGRKEATLKHKEKQKDLIFKLKTRQEQRRRLSKQIKELKKIDTSKMSTTQAKAINNLIDSLDLTKLSKKKRLRLSKTRAYFENNPEAEISEKIVKSLNRLDKKPIRDLNLNEIEGIYTAVKHHVHLEKTKQTIRIGQKRCRVAQVLSEAISEMKPAKKVKKSIISSQSGKLGKLKRIGQLVKDTFGIRHDHYDLIIESLAGQNSTMDKVLYQDVKDGITNELKYKQNTFKKFQDSIEPIVKKYKIKDIAKWMNEKVTTGKFKLTRGERMSLYRHLLNTDNKRSILEGGFGFKYSETPNKIHKITKPELSDIIKSLTKAEKKFAGKPVSELFDNQIEQLDKVFIEKNGYPLPREPNYYPKEIMPLSRGLDIEKEDAIEQFKGKWLRIGLSKGMLEKRLRVKLPIYLNSLPYDINKSVMRSAAYIGLELPLTNASKLLYDPSFRLNLTNKYGVQTWKEIEKGLRDIAGDYQSYTTVDEVLMKSKNNLAVAMLGVNPFVMAKQILSLPVYLPYIKTRFLMAGVIDSIWHPVEVSYRHKLYSPEYLERVEGGYSRDVADVFKAGAEKRVYKGEKLIKEKFMSGIKLFDQGAVISGMQGAVLQVLSEFKKGKLSREVRVALDIKDTEISNLTPEQKMQLAYKFADYATERTQPMFSPEHRSSLSRGSTIEKLATMFGSFTNQALNLTRRSFREAIRTKDPQAYTKLAKSLMVIFGINTMGVMAIDEVRNRIYGRKGKSIAGRILSSWTGYMFFIRDLAASVVSKIERGTFLGYDVSLPISRIPELLSDAIASGTRIFTEKDKKRKKAAMDFVDSALELSLMLLGIPYSTPKKITKVIISPKKKKSRQQRIIEQQRR